MGIIKESRLSVRGRGADTVSGFNWGAFGFGWIWGLGNGSFKETRSILISELLMFIPIVNIIVFIVWIILRFRAGFKGNKWAHDNRAWYDDQDLKSTQGRYAKIFAILLLICIAGVAYGITHPPDSVQNYINEQNRKQKSKVQTQIEEVIGEIVSAQERRGILNSGEDVAEYFLVHSVFVRRRQSNMIASKYDSNSIKLVLKNRLRLAHYVMRFTKEPSCSLRKKNCSVTMYKKGRPIGKAYYDNRGNIKQIRVIVKE